MNDSFIYKQLELVSLFGNSVIFVCIVLLTVAIFIAYYKFRLEAGIVLLTIFSFPYSLLLKGIFQQSRPLSAIIENQFYFNSYSFPSSHVVFYTVFFGYVLYLTYKLKKLNKFVAYFIRLFSLYFLVLVGISRVYLGMHWTSDVIAGYLFGALFLIVILYLDKSLSKNQNKNNQSH